MEQDAAPAVGRRRLAVELRRLRTSSGRTIQEVAQALECSAGKISRVETGAVGARVQDVREMLDLYGVTGGARNDLLDLVRQARQKPWWFAYADIMPRDSARFFGLQHGAAAIHEYSVVLVPGLLQTEGYATALIGAGLDATTASDGAGTVARRRIELRMRRRSLLLGTEPPTFHVVIDEAVLHRLVGGPQVMASQLRHLLAIGQLPHVTIQVLPFTKGQYAAMGAPFVLFEFAEPDDQRVVYLEQPSRNIYLERPDEVSLYVDLFTDLAKQALTTERSTILIEDRATALS
ncbi:MAG TPA: helix-turn-helix transcriptional regulator [Mycobacteriales bacterium]|nr:helix-turn-helix transcriptional regulator [Mycobacteriales bacterium]